MVECLNVGSIDSHFRMRNDSILSLRILYDFPTYHISEMILDSHCTRVDRCAPHHHGESCRYLLQWTQALTYAVQQYPCLCAGGVSLRICDAQGSQSSRRIPGYDAADWPRCSHVLRLNRSNHGDEREVFDPLTIERSYIHTLRVKSSHSPALSRYRIDYHGISIIHWSQYFP